MVPPIIDAWIEEASELAGVGRKGADVGPLETIAKRTSVSQIVGNGETTVLFGNDVIHLASQVGVILVNQAIFAQLISSGFNESAQFGADVAGHEQRVLARAFAKRIKCSSFR